ncbi:LOW QUALITY PROTEIN: hypothetical protein QTO34_006292 [Cnephaeus nilssonii]|uniref:Uncharacterized protein n=1 Tax=Cnephaeus nilssonii TaxID=3371016 RepID=A0AA40HMD4_CNENI|nr:LOW QUALITY PROTEIN: hypothetical protein QTO34_006292 [Eptesicus nilssonii]
MEAFRTYTPMDPEAPESKAAVVMAFVNQSAADIRRKLQKVDRLGEKSLEDLLIVAKKVYNNWEPPGDKQARAVAAASNPARHHQEQNRRLRGLAGNQEDGKGTARPGREAEAAERSVCLLVTLRVEGTPIDFLVDTGAQHSVLRMPQGKLANKKSWVQGATGMSQYSWTTQRTVDLGPGRVSHSFMVIPECPYPLLGRDLLTKIGAQITFRHGGPQVTDGEGHPIQVLTMRLEDEYRLHQKASPVEGSMDEWLQEFPTAWVGQGSGARRPQGPSPGRVKTRGRPGESQIVLHASGSPEGNSAKHSETEGYRGAGPLPVCLETPLLPVKKPHTNDYRPVQDLREVNKRVMDIHPMVPNPYSLLSSLAPSRVWYTVLDLKDAFFSLPLAPHSQPLFAFEWHDLEEGYSGQLTWTRLPQGFKNSPTIFDEALHEDLGEYRRTHPNLTLLQYVDDILIAADTAEDCKQGTRDLLASLGALGYRASEKKAQICRERVSYLGYILEGGQRRLSDAKKRLFLKSQPPPSEGKNSKRGPDSNPRPLERPVAYLSKKLDPVAAGWPPCLRIIAATALLVKDANKLTLGQEVWITTLHAIEGVLKQPPDRWMSNTRMTHYQSLLLNPPRVRFHPSAALNPATLLPDPDLDAPLHDCAGILEQVHGLRKDLTDHPLPDADVTWFTDGSSFVRDGSRYVGAAVVTETNTVWAEALPSRTSAQRAELVALTKALTLGVGRRLNIYTDSPFTTAHVHGAIYHERGLLTAEGQTIKNKQEILDLLLALWLPTKLAIIHCQGHQKADDPVARGNRRADQAAKAVALSLIPTMALQLPDPGNPVLPVQQDIPWRSYSALGSFPKHRRRRGGGIHHKGSSYCQTSLESP